MEVNKVLASGICNKEEWLVTDDITAEKMKSGELKVFATPAMLALMESTAEKSVREYLEEGTTTVGISADIKHLSATPVGMTVYCESRLTSVEGKILSFDIEVFDEAGKIGEGQHKRCIVKSASFVEKTYSKSKKDL